MTTGKRGLSSITSEGRLDAYLREIRKYPMLEVDEEYMLATRWREHGDSAAAEKLVTSHLRLVVKIAMGYRGYGLPMGELISEGSIGVVRAVNRFDPERGVRLASYAIRWIRAAMQEYILRSWSLVKVGTTVAQRRLFFNLRRLKGKLRLLDDGDMSQESVERIANDLQVPARDVVTMNRRLAAPDHSLNVPLRTENYGEWQDWLADERDSHEIVLAEQQELGLRHRLLIQAMECLNARERHILNERRLKDNPTTLEALSHHYGISRERVRQIELRAFAKLQRIVRGATLEEKPPVSAMALSSQDCGSLRAGFAPYS
jgi:RNA polymerase sigma-32 factor